MFAADIFRDTLARLASVLNRLGIRFHLTGGISAIAYGEPRMTQDVDVVVDPQAMATNLPTFLTTISEEGFLVDPETARRGVASGGMFQIFDLTESLKIDLYPRQMVPGELERSMTMQVFADLALPVVSRADAALSKLIWASKGSSKSRRDLRQMLKRSSAEDRLLVEHRAAELGHAQLLHDILAEQDEIGP